MNDEHAVSSLCWTDQRKILFRWFLFKRHVNDKYVISNFTLITLYLLNWHVERWTCCFIIELDGWTEVVFSIGALNTLHAIWYSSLPDWQNYYILGCVNPIITMYTNHAISNLSFTSTDQGKYFVLFILFGPLYSSWVIFSQRFDRCGRRPFSCVVCWTRVTFRVDL